jgi:hypothetical protein
MIAVSIKLDEQAIEEAKHILRGIPNGWPRAAHRALTRTARSERTLLARLLKKRVKANVGDIKERIYIHYPSFENLRATLEISEFAKSIIDLDAIQTGEGVTYRPSFGGNRVLIRHAFIATGAKRGRQVWLRSRYRIGRIKMIEWKQRMMEAIYSMREPNVMRFIKAEDLAQIQKDGEINLVKNINQAIYFLLEKWRK